MCTVIYIPQEDGFLLSSNRDESFSRKPAEIPSFHIAGKKRVLFPKDMQAGGTWIATGENGEVVVLFNGAFEPYVKSGKYVKSRGVVVKEFLEKETIQEAWNKCDLKNVEPFSLIAVGQDRLTRFVWDGNVKHTILLDKRQPYIWSSCTLYDTAACQKRSDSFSHWLQSRDNFCTPDDLYHFLTTALPDDKENRFVMNRNKVIGTVSISIIRYQPDAADFFYYDLKQHSFSHHTILFNQYSHYAQNNMVAAIEASLV